EETASKVEDATKRVWLFEVHRSEPGADCHRLLLVFFAWARRSLALCLGLRWRRVRLDFSPSFWPRIALIGCRMHRQVGSERQIRSTSYFIFQPARRYATVKSSAHLLKFVVHRHNVFSRTSENYVH